MGGLINDVAQPSFLLASVMAVVTASAGLLMVSNFSYYSPKTINLRERIRCDLGVDCAGISSSDCGPASRTADTMCGLFVPGSKALWHTLQNRVETGKAPRDLTVLTIQDATMLIASRLIFPVQKLPQKQFTSSGVNLWVRVGFDAGSGLAGKAPSVQAGLQKDDDITPEQIVTQYNNFYEFGTDKSDPMQRRCPNHRSWTVSVSVKQKNR